MSPKNPLRLVFQYIFNNSIIGFIVERNTLRPYLIPYLLTPQPLINQYIFNNYKITIFKY